MAKAQSRGLGRTPQELKKINAQYSMGFGVSENVEHEVGKMYHGTGGALEGGVVRPSTERTKYGEGAYAEVGTEKQNALAGARHIAREKAEEQGRLFGTIYEVEPMSNPEIIKTGEEVLLPGQTWARDQKGFKANKAVSFPLNVQAWKASQAYADSEAAQNKYWEDNAI